MPKMTGFEVLSWLKTQPALQQIPVVVLSGSNQVRDVEQARSLGAAEYHVKPADFDDLLKFVRDLDVKWLATPSPAAGRPELLLYSNPAKARLVRIKLEFHRPIFTL